MKVLISDLAWKKLRAYVDNCKYEIGGLGKVTTDGTDFTVHDVEIFTQTVTASYVNLSAETLAKWQVEKAKKKESLVDYKFAWHSHATMGVFWSQTDKDTMESSTEFPWLVSLVMNHKHELLARVDIFKPVHVFIDKVTVEVFEAIDEPLVNACIADIAEKVTQAPIIPARVGFGAGKHTSSMSKLLEREYSIFDDKDDSNKASIERISKEIVEKEDEYNTLLELANPSKREKRRMEVLFTQLNTLSSNLDILSEGVV